MLKNDYSKMIMQDMVTCNDNQLLELNKIFQNLLENYPNTIEIDSSKTLNGCFDEMTKFAKSKALSGCYAMNEEEVIEIMKNYFNLQNQEAKKNFVNFDDFI